MTATCDFVDTIMKHALFLLLFHSLSSLEYGFDVMGKSRLFIEIVPHSPALRQFFLSVLCPDVATVLQHLHFPKSSFHLVIYANQQATTL
jgi:hypothetical protein